MPRPKCYWFKDSIKKTSVESDYWFLSEIGSDLVCFYRQHFYRTFQCMEKSTERMFFIKIILKLVLEPRTKMEVNKFLILDHPNLVKIKEIYESEENIYVVSEMHSMNILDNFIEKKIFNEREVATAMKSVLRGLVHLHDRKIFHRFINPESIVVAVEYGELVVKLDNCFLGTLVTNEVQNSLSTTNLAFAAPEILRSTKEEFAADLWSIGVIVYFLLSGELPFASHNPKDTLVKLFSAKLQLDKIVKLSLTTRDFIDHLVHLDVKKRMTAKEALAHPWINEGLNSMTPLVGLSEKLERYRKLRMIRVRMDVVNSSTYDNLITKCKESHKSGCLVPSSVCGPRAAKLKTSRPVIVTNESDFYYRFGPSANREGPALELNSSNICRLLRCMYRQQEITLFEEAVRCQAYYKSVFEYNEYIPTIRRLLRIPTIEKYLEWRDEMLRLKIKYLDLKRRISAENKVLTWIDMEEDEEEEFEFEELGFSPKMSESFIKTSTISEVQESASEISASKKLEEQDATALSITAEVVLSAVSLEEEESLEEIEEQNPLLLELQQFASLEPLFQMLPEKPELEFVPDIIIKQSIDYEPDFQLLMEVRTHKPKKREQKRNSHLDFMLMIEQPFLFQPFYEQILAELNVDVDDLVATLQHINQLYRYRPPFHPAHLGIDQFTVDQQPDSNSFVSVGEDIDPSRQETRYAHCRAGVVTRKVVPPWLLDVDNPVPLLIPNSEFQKLIHRGTQVPDNCIRTPPDPLPLEHFTIYDLIDDPMMSRFNPFQHPHVGNSTPPRIQIMQRLYPYPEKPRHYRDHYCMVGENLFKKCPYKRILEGKMGKGATHDKQESQARLDVMAEQTKPEIRKTTEGFEMDGGEACLRFLSDSKPFYESEKFENDTECVYLTGRPCRLEAFDAEGKICVVSRDGDRRLCCENLYQIWDRVAAESGSAARESLYKASIKAKANSAKRILGSLNIVEDAAGSLHHEQDDKVSKKSNGSEFQRQLNLLRGTLNDRMVQASCKEDSWGPSESDRHNSEWSTTLLM